MSKKSKPSKQDKPAVGRYEEPPASPAHAASREVIDHTMDPRDNWPDVRADDHPWTDGKVHRHATSGQYVPGPTVPDMPASHDVTAIDLNDDSQGVAMRRSTAPSMPNAMPAGPDVRPAVNVLDMSTLQELTE